MNVFKQVVIVVVILSLGSIAYLSGKFSPLFLLCAFTSMWLLQIMLQLIASRLKITVLRSAPELVQARVPYRVQVCVQATGRIPCLFVTVKDEWHTRRFFSFLQREHRYTYTIKAPERGVYVSNEAIILLEDGFGLVTRKRTIREPFRFVVYPYVRTDAATVQLMPQSSVDDLIVRPYAQGDRIGAVHWKWTAKKRRLIVRTNENEYRSDKTDVLLLLDITPEWFEYRLEIAAGWIMKYGKLAKWSLMTSTGIRARNRHGSLQQALTWLAGLKPSDSHIKLPPINAEQTVYYFVSNLDDSLVRKYAQLQGTGCTVVIAWCMPKNDATCVKKAKSLQRTLQRKWSRSGIHIVRLPFSLV